MGGKFDRVGEEVVEDLFELALVGRHRLRDLPYLCGQLYPVLKSYLPDHDQASPEEMLQMEPAQVQLLPARLDF